MRQNPVNPVNPVVREVYRIGQWGDYLSRQCFPTLLPSNCTLIMLLGSVVESLPLMHYNVCKIDHYSNTASMSVLQESDDCSLSHLPTYLILSLAFYSKPSPMQRSYSVFAVCQSSSSSSSRSSSC